MADDTTHAVLVKQVGPGPAFTYEAFLWQLPTPVQTRWGESVDYIATMRTDTPGLCYAVPAEATGSRLIGFSPIGGIEIYGTHEAVLAKLGFKVAVPA